MREGVVVRIRNGSDRDRIRCRLYQMNKGEGQEVKDSGVEDGGGQLGRWKDDGDLKYKEDAMLPTCCPGTSSPPVLL